MKKYSFLIVVLVLAFAKAGSIQAQGKQERESRVERSEFPEASLKLVALLSQNGKRTRFYKEQDGGAYSFEMKTKVNGQWRSAEFSLDGHLEDIEVKINKRDINKTTRQGINRVLDSISKKSRIEKVQEQYVFTGDASTDAVNRLKSRDYDHYELVVAFKDARKIYRKELLFNKNGTLIFSRPISRLQYDFILF